MIAAIIAVLHLVSPSLASAECAWVLWLSSQDDQTGYDKKRTTRTEHTAELTFESKLDCEQMKGEEQQKGDDNDAGALALAAVRGLDRAVAAALVSANLRMRIRH